MFHKYTYENLLSKIHIWKPFIFTTIYPISSTNYSLDSMCIGKRYIYIYISLTSTFASSFTLLSCFKVVCVTIASAIDKTFTFICMPIVPPSREIPVAYTTALWIFWQETNIPCYKKKVAKLLFAQKGKLKRPIIKVFQFYFKRYFDCINNFYLSLMIFLVLMMDDKKFKSSNWLWKTN